MKTIKYLLIAAALFFGYSAQAQVRLSDEEKESLQIAVKQKLDFFQDQLTLIAARRSSMDIKNQAVKATLALFIGKGEPYTVYENNGRAVQNTGVKMQTSSVNSSVKRSQLMKTYLNRLKNMLGYADNILIESADAIKIGEIFPEKGTGRYYATATICRHFVHTLDSGDVIHDYTVHTVKFYVDPDFLDSSEVNIEGIGIVPKILLGDVSAIDTWR